MLKKNIYFQLQTHFRVNQLQSGRSGMMEQLFPLTFVDLTWKELYSFPNHSSYMGSVQLTL